MCRCHSCPGGCTAALHSGGRTALLPGSAYSYRTHRQHVRRSLCLWQPSITSDVFMERCLCIGSSLGLRMVCPGQKGASVTSVVRGILIHWQRRGACPVTPSVRFLGNGVLHFRFLNPRSSLKYPLPPRPPFSKRRAVAFEPSDHNYRPTGSQLFGCRRGSAPPRSYKQMLRGEVSRLSLYANNIQLLPADGYPTPWLIKSINYAGICNLKNSYAIV